VNVSGTTEGSQPPKTLEERRVALRLSREELAALAGLSPRTIYNVEHGLRRPHRATRFVLAAVLGCEPSELASNRNDPPGQAGRCTSAGTGRRDGF